MKSEENKFNLIPTIGKVVKVLWNINKRYVFFMIFQSIFLGIVPLISSLILKYIIDMITSGTSSPMAVIQNFAIILIIELTLLIYNNLSNVYIPIVVMKIAQNINNKIYRKASRIKYSLFESAEFYNQFEMICREKDNITSVMTSLLSIASSFISLIFIFPVLFSYNWILCIAIILINVPISIIQIKIKQYDFKYFIKNNPLQRYTRGLINILTSKYFAKEVRVYNTFDWIIKKYNDSNEKLIHENKELLVNKSRVLIVGNSIKTFLNNIINIFIALSVLVKNITIGSFSLFLNYISRIDGSLNSIIGNILILVEKGYYLNTLFGFLETDENTSLMEISEGNVEFQPEGFEIEFKNISFTYPNQNRKALNNVSFIVKTGQTIALVGFNGAGKSTLVKLLLKFYEPDTGDILVNGINIKELDAVKYYKFVSVMLQDYAIYPFTLKENVFMRDIDDREANQLFSIHKYEWFNNLIEKLPQNINTTVLPFYDKKGVQLSEGESQKVALERALMKENSKLLILDEPSSALDAKTEYEIFKEFKTISQGKTSIFISHRLSSATLADYILYIENGEIIEKGSHEVLMNKNGKYAELFNMQAEKYK